MERYLEIVLPALAAAGATVHAIARHVDASPGAGITTEQIVWADEHDAPSGNARAALQHAAARFAPDVAVAHNVMDPGIVEALRAAPRLVYHAHDHRPFCPNGDRLFPRSAEICAQPIGRRVRGALADRRLRIRSAAPDPRADPPAASGCATRSPRPTR